MSLGERPFVGCGESEVRVQCGDYIELCGVRRTEELKGLEWLISNSENKLCYPFWLPEMILGDRPTTVWFIKMGSIVCLFMRN